MPTDSASITEPVSATETPLAVVDSKPVPEPPVVEPIVEVPVDYQKRLDCINELGGVLDKYGLKPKIDLALIV